MNWEKAAAISEDSFLAIILVLGILVFYITDELFVKPTEALFGVTSQ